MMIHLQKMNEYKVNNYIIISSSTKEIREISHELLDSNQNVPSQSHRVPFAVL